MRGGRKSGAVVREAVTSGATPVRILIADDHEVVRRGLRALLDTERDGREWAVAGEASTGQEAVEKAKLLKPDVVILDISMPRLNGLDAARVILKAVPKVKILILTMHESEELIRNVLDTGAHGYLFKSDAGRDLVAAVDAVQYGKFFFTSKVGEKVLKGYLAKQAATAADIEVQNQLTPREREIVQLLAEGKSSKEVAVSLNLSVNTAETHRANIMRKLDLHSISELVRYAIRNNITQP